MTPKTFWIFFLRIFGLYLIWQTFLFLPQFFSLAMEYLQMVRGPYILITSEVVFLICFYFIIIRSCIFRPDIIIDKLNLTKELGDEKIEVNIHRSSLLSIAIIVLGGIMLADSLPPLVYNTFEYFQHNEFAKFKENPSSPALIANSLKTIIGYFMMADSRLIVNFIERKRKKTTEIE